MTDIKNFSVYEYTPSPGNPLTGTIGAKIADGPCVVGPGWVAIETADRTEKVYLTQRMTIDGIVGF